MAGAAVLASSCATAVAAVARRAWNTPVANPETEATVVRRHAKSNVRRWTMVTSNFPDDGRRPSQDNREPIRLERGSLSLTNDGSTIKHERRAGHRNERCTSCG